MKYIAFVLLSFCFISPSYAGLFEYTQGEKTRINATKYESADVVESLQIPATNYSYSNPTFNNYSYSHSQYSNNIKPTVFADDYYSYDRPRNYYNSDEIIKEMQYYISIANPLRNDIAKIRGYGSEYTPLRKQLEKDLRDIEKQIKYLSELRRTIARTNNYNNHTNQYYYKDNFRSARLVNYYRKYGYEYPSYLSSYYHYNSQYGHYQRKQKWLNENLQPRDEGYIYIK